MDIIDYSEFVPAVHFEQIPIKNLVSNQEYQRNLSRGHIDRTVKNFDLYQINPVKVSRRDGMNYVINGQHTIEIIAAVSGSRETPVWCMVYDEMEYEHEAYIFANQQKYVKALSPLEIFKANIEAGNDTQLIIKELVESYKLKIGAKSSDGNICAVGALEDIYRNGGYHLLDRTIRLCVAAWEGEKISLSRNMLKGVARLIVTYKDKIDDNYFKEKMGQYSPKEISRAAKERGLGTLGYAEAIVLFYNRKMRNQLDPLELHNKIIVDDIPETDELLPGDDNKILDI